MDDQPENYSSLTFEYWCELLSTIEVKYESKRAAVHISKISSSRAAFIYDSDESMRITMMEKAKTGVSNYTKASRRAHDRHHGIHRYCVLCKK